MVDFLGQMKSMKNIEEEKLSGVHLWNWKVVDSIVVNSSDLLLVFDIYSSNLRFIHLFVQENVPFLLVRRLEGVCSFSHLRFLPTLSE